jgi:hypothetical protein
MQASAQASQQSLWLHQLRRAVLTSQDGVLHYSVLDGAWSALYGMPFRQAVGWAPAAALSFACTAGVVAPVHGQSEFFTATVTPAHIEQLVKLSVAAVIGGSDDQQLQQHVTYEAVCRELDVWLGHRSLPSLRLPPAGHTPCLMVLQQRLARISTTIAAYTAIRSLRTFHELQRELCRQEGVAAYVELGLGPLTQHPLVVADIGWGPRNTPRPAPVWGSLTVRFVIMQLVCCCTQY